MNSIIYFFLIGAFSNIIGEASWVDTAKIEIEYYIEKGLTNFTGSSKFSLFSYKNNLKLRKGAILGQTHNSIVWKGVHNDNVEVAVKIVSSEICFGHEVDILKALNAINNPEIEEHGIPRVYYHGKFLHVYHAIAMTLFDETLKDVHDRYEHRGKHLSELSILLIFKGAIESLKYLHTKKIVHNDIKPANLFRRGATIFISDFDLASFEDEQLVGFTIEFASSNFFAKKPRHQIDDLESLVFAIWYVACVPGEGSKPYLPEGLILFQCKQNGTAEEKMKERCKHFKDENVRKAFELVAADEMLINKKVPNFERIIHALNNAIDTIYKHSGPGQPDWMKKSSTSDYSRFFPK